MTITDFSNHGNPFVEHNKLTLQSSDKLTRRQDQNRKNLFYTRTFNMLKYSVVSIKRTGCNKRTGWSKNLIYDMKKRSGW